MRTEAGNEIGQGFMCTSRYILGVRTTTATREQVSNIPWSSAGSTSLRTGCHLHERVSEFRGLPRECPSPRE